jgi:hypothetical protein
MKRHAVVQIRVDLTNGPLLEVELPEGAKIVHYFTGVERQAPIIADVSGRVPQLVAVPTLVVWMDPGASLRMRNFHVTRAGSAFGAPDEDHIEHVATFVIGQDQVLVMFEILRPEIVGFYEQGALPDVPAEVSRCWRDSAKRVHHVFRAEHKICVCGRRKLEAFDAELDEQMTIMTAEVTS